HRHNIGTVLLFPRKGIHAILGTVKICKAAVFHPGRRLFSSERRWFYFAKGNFQHNVQSRRQGISPYGQAWQEPGIHTCYSLVYLNQNPQFFSKLNKVWDILI
ncbi:hypothetical protein, partial [Faecalibaculum rodentium]|uniref:hypothetical protein n=1 Tax=Faecalibaculum rodentium TaxID=1702221 RepID=UPI002610296A